MDIDTAVIPVGGKGSRMTSARAQKCLTSVHGHPILYYPIEALRRNGCRRLFLLGGHLSEQIEEFVQANYCGLFSKIETKVLALSAASTAEALMYVSGQIDAPFFYTHGDIAFSPDVLSLVSENWTQDALATMAFSHIPLASTHPYCRVQPKPGGGTSVEFEFPTAESPHKLDLCSMETMILLPEIFEYLPLVPFGAMMARAIALASANGRNVTVVPYPGEWLHLENDDDLKFATNLEFFRSYEQKLGN